MDNETKSTVDASTATHARAGLDRRAGGAFTGGSGALETVEEFDMSLTELRLDFSRAKSQVERTLIEKKLSALSETRWRRFGRAAPSH